MPTSLPKRLALAAAVLPLLVCTALVHRDASRRRAAFPVEEDLVYLPREGVLRALSIKHPEAMADLVFLRTVTYFGAQLVGAKNYDWLKRHLDTVVALDPYFRTAYKFGGHAAMYNGKPIDNAAVEMSTHFLQAGLARFPSDWEFAFMLGCNYMFELKSNDPAVVEQNKRTGGEYIKRAALAHGGPSWLPGLAATIMSREGQTEAALRYLEEAYLTANDERTREDVWRLLLAKRKASNDALAAARDRFTSAWQRDLPYAPADLYVIVGEPPSLRLDWRWLVSQSGVDRVLQGDAEPTPGDAPKAPTDR